MCAILPPLPYTGWLVAWHLLFCRLNTTGAAGYLQYYMMSIDGRIILSWRLSFVNLVTVILPPAQYMIDTLVCLVVTSCGCGRRDFICNAHLHLSTVKNASRGYHKLVYCRIRHDVALTRTLESMASTTAIRR